MPLSPSRADSQDTSMGSQARLSRADRRWLTLLAVTAGAVIVAHLVGAHGARARSTLGSAALTLAFAVPAWAVLVSPRPEGRAQRRPLALVLSFGAIVFLGFLLHVLTWPTSIPFGGESAADVVVFVPFGLVLVAIRQEFVAHFRRDDRREALADIVLIAAAIGGVVFLLLQLPQPGRSDFSSIVFASMVIAPVAWGALLVWTPSVEHVGLFVAWSAIAAGLGQFGYQWIRQRPIAGNLAIELP